MFPINVNDVNLKFCINVIDELTSLKLESSVEFVHCAAGG